MNAELTTVVEYLEKERGIERETLLEVLEDALLSASRKSIGPAREVRIEIDRETCDIRALATVEVVEKVKSKHDEISLRAAQDIKKDAKFGDLVEIEVTPKNFGRIAAQTAKQAIMQNIRRVEKDIIQNEYKDRIGDVVSGSVRSFDRSDVVIDLGRASAIMPTKERVPTEEYQIGDRIRAYILALQNSAVGPDLILSRSHPNFVQRLFELEVAEIADGVVEIKGIAREAGYRTKIAVLSHDSKVDPVGACVGMRGIRVKNIVRELSGEKIDIVRWSDDAKTYVVNALSPAKLVKVLIEEEDGQPVIRAIADADQLSLAIGKRGQNVRLTAKLLGMRVDVRKDESEVSFEDKVAQAVASLAEVGDIGEESAQKLVGAGFLTVEGILSASPEDIAEAAEIEPSIANTIYEAAMASQEASAEEETAVP
jgi:N utilization substance protein A